MAHFAVDHDAAPVVALIEGFDVYDAARKYTRLISADLMSEIEQGEVLEICELVPENGGGSRVVFGDTHRLEWVEAIRNFKKLED